MDNIEELYEEIENLGLEITFNKTQLDEALSQGTKSKQFQDLIYFITFEIHNLGNTEEEIHKDNEFNEFMLELSAFLKELCCPYDNFIAGPLSDRFKSKNERMLLLSYLATELMSLKICFKLKPEEQSYIIPKFESTTARALETIAKELNLGKPPQNITSKALFQKINTTLTESLQKTNPAKLGKSLFNTKKLTDTQWKQMENIYNTLNQEYILRREMLLTRLDVTVQSFQWSDKIKKTEDKIVNRYQSKLSEITLNQSNESDISDLLAARNDLAIIEKTSNASVRKNTFCKLQKHIIGLVPDRGGRANEHAPPPPEMPSWQTQRNNGPGGGSGRGGFQSNRGGGGNFQNQGRGGGFQGGNRDQAGARGGFQGNQARDNSYQGYGRGGGGGQKFGYETSSNNNFQPQYNQEQFDNRSNINRVQGGWNPGRRSEDNWNSDKNVKYNNDNRGGGYGHGRGGNFTRGRSNYNRGGSHN